MRRAGSELLNRLFRFDASDLRRLPRAGIRLLRMIAMLPREFLKDHGPEWAAALAYYTVLSLVPLGILAFSLADVFETFFNLQDRIIDLLREQGLPDAADKAGDVIESLIASAKAAKGKMGVVGTAGLILTAMGLFSALDRAFNRVWKTGIQRTFLQRFRAFWFILTLGPFLAGISVWATAKLRSAAVMESMEYLGPLWRASILLVPFLLTWCLFFVINMYVPNTRVRPRSALMGAIVAGTVWELAKRGFNLYVANAAQIDRVYGPIGIFPLFILWTYVTWTIVLLGCELAYVDQNFRAILSGIVEGTAETGAPREFHALRILLAIYEPFRAGRPSPDLPRICHDVAVRNETGRLILEDLQNGGFVRRDQGGAYLPAREASQTNLADVLKALRGPVPADPEKPRLLEVFLEAEGLRATSFRKTTLADLLDATPPAAAK